MKIIVPLIVLLSALISAPVYAQSEFTTSGLDARTITLDSNRGAFEVNLTQSTDPNTIDTFNSIACAIAMTSITRPNSYFRVFDLDGAFGLTDPFTVENVNLGVETADPGTGTDQPISVVLHTLPSATPFVFANLTEVGRLDTTIGDVSESLVNFAVTSSAIQPELDLVVEVESFDGEANSAGFFIGSNDAGQSAPSFLAAADCGIAEPTDLASVGGGFPDMHIVMTVSGSLEPPLPESQPVPVNNFWALGLMVLILAGLGLVVIRRMF